MQNSLQSACGGLGLTKSGVPEIFYALRRNSHFKYRMKMPTIVPLLTVKRLGAALFVGLISTGCSSDVKVQAIVNSLPGPTQQDFCRLVNDFRQKYVHAKKAEANEAALSEIRYDRKQAFKAVINSGDVDGWVGYLYTLGTNSEGSASLRIVVKCANDDPRPKDRAAAKIGDVLSVSGTRIFSDNKLPRGTPLYSKLMGLKEGGKITFSGNFPHDDSHLDFVSEVSLFEMGSMEDPDFAFDITDVEKVSGTK